MLRFLFLAFFMMFANITNARVNLSDLVGYQVLYQGYITGYMDGNSLSGKFKKNWEFEGCEWDRAIFLDEQYVVYCEEYNYTYSYHPEAIILTNGRDSIMVVDNTKFKIRLR